MLDGFRSWRRKNWTHEQQMQEQRHIEEMRFESEEEEVLFKEAGIGLQVSEFWESEAGKYLRRRALHDMKAATDALIAISPLDHAGIANHQATARACQLLAKYVSEAINGGESAELEIENRERNRDENNYNG